MNKKSKITLCCALVAAIVITGYANYKMNEKNDTTIGSNTEGEVVEETSNTEDINTSQVFFTEFKTEKEETRNKEIEYLDSIINSGEADETVTTQAMNQKMEITKAMETELLLEGLIKGSGYNDAVVTYSEGAINVVIANSSLTDEQALQIMEIVKNETGESPQNIKIIPQG